MARLLEEPRRRGVETRVDWTLPAGVTAGPLLYPVPTRLVVAGPTNYVYQAPRAQFAELRIPAGLAPGTRLPVRAKVDYLVCTLEVCVPETQTVATTLTVGDGTIPPDTRARFDAWRRALPAAGFDGDVAARERPLPPVGALSRRRAAGAGVGRSRRKRHDRHGRAPDRRA
ncbi:protein-disulfide reductase DsbD domain-containing protein [Sphingomonas sp. MMS24-JH45]